MNLSIFRIRLPLAAFAVGSCVGLGFAFLGPADKAVAVAEKAKLATVPFEMLDSNHMVVNAKINGKGPFRLVFDLGAPITLLGNKTAEASGVVKPDAPKSFLFSMRGEGKVDGLDVGDLKAKDIPVIVFDHPVLKALSGFLGRPLDGIIGFTFFARYKTTIDYQAKVMTFEPVDYEVRDLMKDLPNRLAGPKRAKDVMLTPLGLWGLTVAKSNDGGGVKVTSVTLNSPASEAGLKPGDLLTTLDGRWTSSVADVFAAASVIAPGQAVEAVVVREGKSLTIKVTPRAGF